MKKDTVSYCNDHNYSRMLIKDEQIISLLNHMQHVQKGSASFLLYTCKLTVWVSFQLKLGFELLKKFTP